MKNQTKFSPKPQSQAVAGAAELHLSDKFLWSVMLLLILVGAGLYANSLRCSFQFDDGYYIVENPLLHDPFDLRAIWSWGPMRFLTNFSLAINYYFSGPNVVPFHVTNILIHVASGILIFFLIWLTTRTPLVRHQFSDANAKELALVSSLIFLCHPLQTQAVTYIVQRAASLATLFYLGTLVCYAMARLTASSRWYWASCAACLLAMFTKQTAFTLPFMILLYDWAFFAPEHRTRNEKILRYFPFLIALAIIPLITQSHSRDAVAQQYAGIPVLVGSASRPEYLMTQFNVIRTYLRLLFFPVNQNLEYDYPIAHSLTEPHTLASFLLLAGILSFALWIFRKQRLIAFGIFWFFITLSVESSIIPIPHVIFEHRVYLPLVGFAIAISAGAYALLRQKKVCRILMIAGLILLSFLTVKRNRIWETKFTLWQDVVKKSPNMGSSHYSLGLSLAELGRHQEAIVEYQRSLDLGYKHPRRDSDFARAYEALNDLPHATAYYRNSIKTDPTFVPAYNNLGAIYARQKEFAQALEATQRASELAPNNVATLGNLGAIYASLGRYDEATAVLELALRVDPSYVPAQSNLTKIRAIMNSVKKNPETTRMPAANANSTSDPVTAPNIKTAAS